MRSVWQHTNFAGYRYGFNGKEKDGEVQGDGNSYDYGFRIYNPRLGRFLSVDPLFRGFPWWTPYQFAGNNPIRFIDLDGKEKEDPQSTDEPIEEEIPLDELKKGLIEPLPPSLNNDPEKPESPNLDLPDDLNNPLNKEFGKEFKEKIADPLEKGIITDFIDKNLEDKEFQKKIANAQFDIVLNGTVNPGKIAIVESVTISIITETSVENQIENQSNLVHQTETNPINFKNPSKAIPENGETAINPDVPRIIETPLVNGRKAKVVARIVVIPVN